MTATKRKLTPSRVEKDCMNSCGWANDGECDEDLGTCQFGTDCNDCGAKEGYYIRLEFKAKFTSKRHLGFQSFEVFNEFTEPTTGTAKRNLVLVSTDNELNDSGTHFSALGSIRHPEQKGGMQHGDTESCFATKWLKKSHDSNIVYYVTDGSMSFSGVTFTNSVGTDAAGYTYCGQYPVSTKEASDGEIVQHVIDAHGINNGGLVQEVRVLVSMAPNGPWTSTAIDWSEVGIGQTTLLTDDADAGEGVTDWRLGENWAEAGDMKYKYFGTKMTWSAAEAFCARTGEGAHLASISNEDENKVVVMLAAAGKNVGLSSHDNSNTLERVMLGLSSNPTCTHDDEDWRWSSTGSRASVTGGEFQHWRSHPECGAQGYPMYPGMGTGMGAFVAVVHEGQWSSIPRDGCDVDQFSVQQGDTDVEGEPSTSTMPPGRKLGTVGKTCGYPFICGRPRKPFSLLIVANAIRN
jgi:hypothetical protein